jgi:preprotein translocase subunit SecF
MNQVMMRSLITSFSSILPVISLLLVGSGFLGAVALQEFALALLVGMISGVYSSIFIAAPLLATLKAKTGRKTRRQRLVGEDLRAAVMGAGVTGRVLSSDDLRPEGADDEEQPGELVTTGAATPADRLLTHPPRPRKKKRR